MIKHALKETPRWRWFGLYALFALLLVTAPVIFVSADENDVPEDGVVSPDGERIAWISEDEESVWSAERISDSNDAPEWGSPERLLTIHGTVENLVFSPDSENIAFENHRSSGSGLQGYADHGFIAIYSLENDEISFPDPSFGIDIEPEWSDDGEHISFIRQVQGIPDEHKTVPIADIEDDSSSSLLESMLDVPHVSELTSAGDGQSIAYMAREGVERNIYFMLNGEDAHLAVSYPDDDGLALSQIAISEHGDALAYVRGDGYNPESLPTPPEQEVWVKDLPDGDLHLLGTGSNPHFSPDNERVIWTDDQRFMSASLSWEDGNLQIGDAEELFTFEGSIQMPRFSPGGDQLAFHRASGIDLYNFETENISRISVSDASLSDLSWSPDGDQIAFRQSTSGEPWGIGLADVSTLETKEVWQASEGRGSSFFGLAHQDEQLFWSDDDQIAFVWEGDGWRHLYAVPATGADNATLLTPGEGEVENAAVSHDHTKLIYSTNMDDPGRRHLWEADFSGEEQKTVTDGSASQWAPTPIADGSLAYIEGGWADPTSVKILDASGDTKQANLPEVPEAFPEEEMVNPEFVEFPGTDGETAYGQLFEPSMEEANGCAVIFAHGGPRRSMVQGYHYIETYSNLYGLNQYLANQGCTVLSVEYRSGVMYGYDFRNAENAGRSGASEYKDILGAAEYLQNHENVDPDRLGIHGLSWGGYITALALARDSETFKVGFDMAGVHDFFGDQHPHSPMANIDDWTSPVYVAHGDRDRAVTFSQSVILNEALKARNVEMEQHVFPDEAHEMELRFEHMADVYGGGSEFLLDHLAATPSVSNMQTLIGYFEEEGEINNPAAARLLSTHLTAVGHYEDTDQMAKALRHMHGFQDLLDHQVDNDVISERVYGILGEFSGDLIEEWS